MYMSSSTFECINLYILKSKGERQSHLDLKTECIEIGGADSRHYRGLLAHTLKTTIPNGWKIILCHACNNHKCSNVKHLYWGTASENLKDAYECGVQSGEKIKQSLIVRYGSEENLKKHFSENGKKNKGRILDPDKTKKRVDQIMNSSIDFTKFGWVQKVAVLTGIGNQGVARFMRIHLPDFYKNCFVRK